jgi:sterol desaturase/sphingolipid hydroxylase (fatty acid hydroxylase superfamily)
MVPELSKSIILQLFVMSASISVLMFIIEKITHKLDITSMVLDVLIRVLICYFVVFTEGCLFGMFLFEWKAFLYISPVLIPTFIITYAVSYFMLVDYANEINERIKKKKNHF